MAIDFKDLAKLKWYYQILLVAGVCGGLLAALWYQVLTPIQADIESKNSTLSGLKLTIAKSEAQQKVLAQLKKDSLALQAKLDMLKLVLPLEKETDQVLRSVQQAASSSALRIMRVGFRPIIDHEVYTEWPIDMQVIGTYHNIGTFLDKIRNLPRIVNVAGMRIQGRAPQGDDAFTSSVNATYVATTFVYREEIATAPPVAQTVK
jgi:type IV pilus assembly protein PilO